MDASAELHLDCASGNLIVGGSIPSSLFSLDKGLRREIVCVVVFVSVMFTIEYFENNGLNG